MFFATNTRRSFLRSAGVCLALPTLEVLADSSVGERSETEVPMRMICIGNEFGMYPGAFWPKQAGRNYEMTELLEPLAGLRDDFTLFSHLDHGLKGGHFTVHTFLTGVRSADAKVMPDGGISLDQRAAEHVGARTRFSSLTIGSESGLHGGPMMSWTRMGTRVPPITGPRELFRKLFVNSSETRKRRVADRIALQDSILDAVIEDAKSLNKRVSHRDKEKLEEYYSSVREVEKKLELDRKWQRVPKPEPSIAEPSNQGLTKDLPAIYDLMLLALQTDSTRVASLEIGGSFAASDLGIRQGYHGLSHHGQVKESIRLLVEIEKYQTQQFARFLQRLRDSQEATSDESPLRRTIVLFGSGMGNANSHTNHDLPVILAGGGFRHGEHKVYPREASQRVPLSNLYLSLLQRFGVRAESFSQSTGTLTGLETT